MKLCLKIVSSEILEVKFLNLISRFLILQFSGIVSKCLSQTNGLSCCETVEVVSLFLVPPNILLKNAMTQPLWKFHTKHCLKLHELQKQKKIQGLKSRKKVTVTHHMITFLRHSTVFGQFLLHDRWVKYCCCSLFTFVGYFPKLCLHREHSTSFLPAALSCCTLVHLNRI